VTHLHTNRDVLADALPDLVLLVRRDGILVTHFGGRGVDWLRPEQSSDGKRVDSVWPPEVADLIQKLARRAISVRGTLDAELGDGERRCELQVTAQSPDRAICVIRALTNVVPEDSSSPSASIAKPHFDRRGFLRRFKNSISIAALNERPLAVAIIHVDGVVDISRVLDTKVSDQVIASAIHRLAIIPAIDPAWYIGPLSENELAVVLETASREIIEAFVTGICASLREPIELGDAEFHLIPYAGAAILGRDGNSPTLLLEHARASAIEARRSDYSHICFFSDTLKLRSLARLDVTRELRDAIENRDIKLRYMGRHDLATGRLVALVGYLQWVDPMRGEIRPADFLGIAEATGLSTALSRSILACLLEDFAAFRPQIEPDVRISFGALRHHVLSDSFLSDITSLIGNGALTPDRLELRIAERSYVSHDVDTWCSLANFGIQLVVDEFGRQMSSLDRLARVPLWGLQLDRSWVTAVDRDPVARRVCSAIINVATGLGLTPIATGVDNAALHQVLADLGCRQGLGDFYGMLDFAGSASSSMAISR
jgi:predicted signal transduction protein with EAL and GGDEF domain